MRGALFIRETLYIISETLLFQSVFENSPASIRSESELKVALCRCARFLGDCNVLSILLSAFDSGRRLSEFRFSDAIFDDLGL